MADYNCMVYVTTQVGWPQQHKHQTTRFNNSSTSPYQHVSGHYVEDHSANM
jgi:hypothetical protein